MAALPPVVEKPDQHMRIENGTKGNEIIVDPEELPNANNDGEDDAESPVDEEEGEDEQEEGEAELSDGDDEDAGQRKPRMTLA